MTCLKTCSKCHEAKEVELFSKKSSCKDGLDAQCKACVKIRSLSWREKNLERALSNCRQWHARNPERSKELSDKRYEAKKDVLKIQRKAYRAINPDKVRAYAAKYRKSLIAATTNWANMFFIEEAYSLAKLRTKITDIEWEVDHIVPLQSKYVCGLHCEQNLQVVTSVVNKKKCNSWWPDMPEEFLCQL